jgi:hypothetical protein
MRIGWMTEQLDQIELYRTCHEVYKIADSELIQSDTLCPGNNACPMLSVVPMLFENASVPQMSADRINVNVEKHGGRGPGEMRGLLPTANILKEHPCVALSPCNGRCEGSTNDGEPSPGSGWTRLGAAAGRAAVGTSRILFQKESLAGHRQGCS